MAMLFISQARLDTWLAENRVAVDGDVMTLRDDGRSFRIRPAVRFLRVAGGAQADPHDLVGRVKDEAALSALGADHYLDSVILGEVAYDVQSGFLGEARVTGADRVGLAAAVATPAIRPTCRPRSTAPWRCTVWPRCCTWRCSVRAASAWPAPRAGCCWPPS